MSSMAGTKVGVYEVGSVGGGDTGYNSNVSKCNRVAVSYIALYSFIGLANWIRVLQVC